MADQKKLNHEELLKKILNDPQAAIAKQLLIPAAATNFITTKRMLGVFDRADQLQLASETISYINHIAEHDYIAFLVFTNRFDEIREIFGKDERFKQLMVLINALERERKEEQHQQMLMNEQERIAFASRQQQQQEQLSREKDRLLKQEQALMHMDMYRYYSQLQQEIENDFHKTQIQILDRAYQGRRERINEAINIANNDPSIAPEDRAALIELEDRYAKELELIKQIPTHKQDGSIDHEGLRRQSEAMRALDEGIGSDFSGLLDKLAAKHPHNEKLGKVRRDEAEAVKVTHEELRKNEEVRDVRTAENAVNLEQTRLMAKEELEKSMSNSLSVLNRCIKSDISEAQREVLQNSYTKIKEYRNTLAQTKDLAQLQDLTSRFTDELSRVKDIARQFNVDPVALQELDNEVILLGQLRERLNAQPIPLEKPSASVSSAAPSSDQPQMDIPPPSAPLLSNEEFVQVKPVAEESQQQRVSGNATSFFRGQMNHVRAQGEDIHAKLSVPMAPPTQDVSDGRTIEFDGEPKEHLTELTSTLPDVLDDINNQGNLSAEDAETATELQKLFKQIAPTIDGAVEVAKIELAQKLFDKLQDNHPELVNYSEKFNSVIGALSNSPRLGS